MYSMEKEDYFEEFFTDIGSVLEDLAQSGFHTVHDSTLEELKEKGETAAQYGMRHLSGLLISLQEELSANRHKIRHTDAGEQNADSEERADSRCAEYYTELIRYVNLGREKTAYDRGKNYYLGQSRPNTI